MEGKRDRVENAKRTKRDKERKRREKKLNRERGFAFIISYFNLNGHFATFHIFEIL